MIWGEGGGGGYNGGQPTSLLRRKRRAIPRPAWTHAVANLFREPKTDPREAAASRDKQHTGRRAKPKTGPRGGEQRPAPYRQKSETKKRPKRWRAETGHTHAEE